MPRDTSAAALVAYGLIGLPESGETGELVAFGERILDSLVAGYLTPRDSEDDQPAGRLLEGCFNGPSGYVDQHELVWSEYHLAYELHRWLSTQDTKISDWLIGMVPVALVIELLKRSLEALPKGLIEFRREPLMERGILEGGTTVSMYS